MQISCRRRKSRTEPLASSATKRLIQSSETTELLRLNLCENSRFAKIGIGKKHFQSNWSVTQRDSFTCFTLVE